MPSSANSETAAPAAPVDSHEDEKVPNPLFEELAPEHWVESLPPDVQSIPDYSYLSRFQFINGPPQLAPYKCAGCSGYNGLFLDINLELDGYGKFYWCSNCIREIAQQIGYAPRELWSQLQEAIDKKQAELDRVVEENNELRNALGSLRTVFTSPDDDSTVDSVPVKESDEIKSGGDETTGGSPAGEKSDAKPANVKGRSKLLDSSSDVQSLLDAL